MEPYRWSEPLVLIFAIVLTIAHILWFLYIIASHITEDHVFQPRSVMTIWALGYHALMIVLCICGVAGVHGTHKLLMASFTGALIIMTLSSFFQLIMEVGAVGTCEESACDDKALSALFFLILTVFFGCCSIAVYNHYVAVHHLVTAQDPNNNNNTNGNNNNHYHHQQQHPFHLNNPYGYAQQN